MQLNPQESFTIVRQIGNHNDTETYYVRAVIRNAKTDALLETLNLEDKGSYRFSKTWLVPRDASGQGFWISIVTSVYTTDSYDVKAENYSDEEATYLIQERYTFNPNYPVGQGGPDIDYKKIRKIIKEEIAELEIEPPEAPEVIKMEVEKVVPVVNPVDFTMVLGETKAIKELINLAIKTVGEKTMASEGTILKEIASTVSSLADEIQLITEEMGESIKDNSAIVNAEKNIQEGLDKLDEKIESLKKVEKTETELPDEKSERVSKFLSKKPAKKLPDERVNKLLLKS